MSYSEKTVIAVLFLIIFTQGGCGGAKPKPFVPKIFSEATRDMQKGNMWYNERCLEKSFQYYFRANEMYTLSDNLQGIADSLNNIGNVYRGLGETGTALMYYREALIFYQKTSDTKGEIRALSNQAAALIHSGLFEEAHVMIQTAADKAEENKVTYLPLKVNLGIVLTKLERYDQAESVFKRLLDQPLPLKESIHAQGNFAMGTLMAKMERHKEAIPYFTRALEADRRAAHARSIADDLFGIGSAWLSLGEMEKAEELLKRSLKIYTLLQETALMEKTTNTLQELCRKIPCAPGNDDVTTRLLEKWENGTILYEPCN